VRFPGGERMRHAVRKQPGRADATPQGKSEAADRKRPRPAADGRERAGDYTGWARSPVAAEPMQTQHVLATVLCAAGLVAQAPPGYYNSVNAANPTVLRATLHALIDDHTRFPYTASSTDTWDILESAQQNPNNASQIVDIYRNGSYAKIGGGVGPYNREHAWPKSYGFPNDGSDNYPYTDCFSLKLCDSGYNTARSNRPYAATNAAASEYSTQATNGSGGGNAPYPGTSNWADSATTNGRWEVWSDRRGDCARALFYMDVRYEGGTHGGTNVNEPNLILTDNLSLIVSSNTGNNATTAYMGMLSTLLQWHQQDPVDAREMALNDIVFSHQGNRNPFIDHPEWVDCLFANNCSASNPPPDAPTALVATTQKRRVNLDWADNTETDLAGYQVFRSSSPSGPWTQLNAAPVATSAYADVGMLDGTLYFYKVRAVDTANQASPDSNVDMTRWLKFPIPTPDKTPSSTGSATTVWINEIHYDNNGTDTGEFVEVAGPAGQDLTGWSLVGYNGNGGGVYVTVPLAGAIANQQNGMGCRAFSILGLQNGAPDGIALVNAQGAVVEFLSYEGSFTANGGPANGMASVDIGVSEDDTTPVGFSLQLQGTGHAASAFTWSAPLARTLGQPNVGQTLQ
jgi:endonuclease I